MQSTATSRALQTPELLSWILSFCPTESLLACGRTCQFWEYPALSLVWHELEDTEPLFALLGPLKCSDDITPIFEDYMYAINLSGWRRFEYYAPMVKKIWFHPCETHPRILEKALQFGMMAGTRTLLPRLTTLKYTVREPSDFGRVLNLLSPDTASSLHLDIIDGAPSAEAEVAFQFLTRRAPNLTTLRITCNSTPLLRFAHNLPPMLGSLEHLIHLHLPSDVAVDRPVWTVLSSLKTLRTLRHDSGDDPEHPPITGEGSLSQPKFIPGCFPSLEMLTLSLRHTVLTNLFSTLAPESLTHVALALRGIRVTSEVEKCIAAVASSCPQLRHFRLLHGSPSPVTINSIRPLLNLRGMETLHLLMPHTFSDQDIELIARAFPRLTSLHLCPSPLRDPYDHPTLTWKALLSLATYARALENLAIHIDTFNPPSPSSYAPVRFASLIELNFGGSNMASRPSNVTYMQTLSELTLGYVSAERDMDPFNVLIFLADICGKQTHVCSRLLDEDDLLFADASAIVTSRWCAAEHVWSDINKRLGALRCVR